MFRFQMVSSAWFDFNEKTIDKILFNISNNVKKQQKWILNLVFLDNNSIQKLNKEYRNIDKPTDVLSFHYYEDFSQLSEDEVAGEIIMSQEKIISQGKLYWLWTQGEFFKLFIHSVLHILWYDHEDDSDYKIMQQLEDKIYREVFG